MNNLQQKLRRLVPASLKRAVKEKLLQRKLERAVSRIRRLPLGEVPTAEMLRELQTGWSNEGYAARTDYLVEMAKIAVNTASPILECGSGLSTILLGLLAGRRGVRTYSLEHTPEWRARINSTLERLQISGVSVYQAPLREYDGFEWYDPPVGELPGDFGLVICDGPPGTTLGGRYGLMPVLGERLPVGSIVLLDDTERASELEVLRRWTAETSIDVSMRETPTGSFAVITRVEANRPATVVQEVEHSAPAVSVVIPTYKAAGFIRETLESVFAQTFIDYEVIVINDGSPDTKAFEEAIRSCRERIRYISQENGGASAARNAGVRAAAGKFIAFLDADDVWSPDYLAEQMKFIREQNCDLACADALVTGNSTDAGKTYMTAVMATAPPSGEVTFLELVSAERSLITSGVVVRRDLILEVGLFDLTLRNAQDLDLWLRLARHGARLAYHRRVLLEYRAQPASLTGDAINSHQRELRILDRVEQSYPLTPDERREVSAIIKKRRAHIDYELGKLYLLPGNFALARESFARASDSGVAGSWKPRMALWATRVAPGATRALCLRRMGNLTASERLQEVVGI